MSISISTNLIKVVLEKIILQRKSFARERSIDDLICFNIFRLAENETQTTVRIFADHTGVVLDPFGLGLSNTSGIRISPKQSAFFQQRVKRTIFI